MLNVCHEFSKIGYEKQKEFVIAKRCCWSCLRQGHMSKKCRTPSECKKCHAKHPTSLHRDRQINRNVEKRANDDDSNKSGAENGKKDPFSDEIDVDDRDFDRFRPFFGVFYDFEPTSSCFFRHRADIFVFFEIFEL